MKILILPGDAYQTESTDRPIEGHRYTLEDDASGTGAQNRAFHALLQEYYKSGLFSWQVTGFDQFRDYVKKFLGAGFESYAYAEIVDGKPVLKVVDGKDKVPNEYWKDPRLSEFVRGRLKSWTDYTKKERKSTIDMLIADMKHKGVNGKKFDQILEGMQNIW
jgi:hypothetical protein